MNHWIPLVILNSLLNASNSVLDKRMMNDKQQVDPFVCVLSFGVVGLPVAVIGLFVSPSISWLEAGKAVLAGMLFIGAAFLYYDTVSREDISRLAPIMRLSTLQTLLFSVIFLHEMLSARQTLSFSLLVLGCILLSFKSGDRGLTLNKNALRLIPVTTLLSIQQVLMAPIYRETSIWCGEVWHSLGMLLGLLILTLVKIFHGMRESYQASRRVWVILVAEQTVRLGINLISAFVISEGMSVSLVSALEGIRLIWVWILAWFLLRERVNRKEFILKCMGILLMILGVGGVSM